MWLRARRWAKTPWARTLWAVWATALVVMPMFGACTDADLEALPTPIPFRDDKLQLRGQVCTTPPESKAFPVRVMFIVDSSQSMDVTDPVQPALGETLREQAVRGVWEPLLEEQAQGVEFSIIRFASEAQGTTGVDEDGDDLVDSYFTADPVRLQAATEGLRVTSGTTNYRNALSEAFFELRTELLNADLASLPLSRYIVIFVSDGLPDADSEAEQLNTAESILAAVEDLQDLADQFRVGEFAFFTAFLGSQATSSVADEAQELLQAMSDVGGGGFRSFPSGEEINFLFVNFSAIRSVFTLKGLSVVNANTVMDQLQVRVLNEQLNSGVEEGSTSLLTDLELDRMFRDMDGDGVPACGEHLVDSDYDGLSDIIEQSLGTDPLFADTDEDGLNDRIEWRTSGLDALDGSDALCVLPSQCTDLDADGFCDCILDADANGVCDCAEGGEESCLDDLGHDCVDEDLDGYCDCADRDEDGHCDYLDRDGDLLNDCEEVLYGTAQLGQDSDADGLPDWLEARSESDPTNADRSDDADIDTTDNGVEVLSGTDVWCDDSSLRSEAAVRYQIDTLGIADGSSCYAFDVSNVTLVPTARNVQAYYPGNGWNRILLFAGEVAFDDPDAFAAYRVACVMAAYEPDGDLKEPPSGQFTLVDSNFVSAEDFDADRDCIWP